MQSFLIKKIEFSGGVNISKDYEMLENYLYSFIDKNKYDNKRYVFNIYDSYDSNNCCFWEISKDLLRDCNDDEIFSIWLNNFESEDCDYVYVFWG